MSAEAMARFEAKYIPEPNTGCWLWITPNRKPDGQYGSFRIAITSIKAHRASWILHRGPVPPGMFVCHKCDTQACVNPEHLFLGTALDNTRDMLRKGRGVSANAAKSYCPEGHEYTPENTYPDPRGKRQCRICRRASSARSRERRRAA